MGQKIKSPSHGPARQKVGRKMTTEVNMKEIEKVAAELGSVDAINKELRKMSSQKCRLAKNKFQAGYTEKMTRIVQIEQVLKEAKRLLDPKEKPVTMYEQADVDKLDYDETVKALKSIQSKKTNTQWLTDVQFDNDEYRRAEKIEQMLKAHREVVRPLDNDLYIRRSDLQTIIDTIESSGKLSQAKILELLKSL